MSISGNSTVNTFFTFVSEIFPQYYQKILICWTNKKEKLERKNWKNI